MVYKKMTEKEWIEIGNQAERVRKQLFRLTGISYGKMPQLTVAPLKGTLNHLDKFKLQAEGRMFQMGDSQKENIFFGNKTEINVEVEEGTRTRGIKTSYRKMPEQEWIKVGNQAKLVDKELSKLMNMTTGKMPVNIVDRIIKASDGLSKFKTRAEDRMFQMGDSENLNIFFGDVKDLEYKEERE